MNFTARNLLLVGFLLLLGCKQQLYTSLSERDANEMIAVLAAKNLKAEKVATDKGDFRIELDRKDFSAAVESLRDHGLPRPKFSSIGEVFKKEGLVTTANAERLRFMFAMSEELSKTLSLIDGVVEARVHPVLPGGDPLTDKLTPASASVFIKHTTDANLTLLAPAIKDLVCASIEGLTYDKVSLIFVPASKMIGSSVHSSTAPPAVNSYLEVFPTVGIGLAAGFFIMGIGLFVTRRLEKNDLPATTSINRTEGKPSLAQLLCRIFSSIKNRWRKLIGATPMRSPKVKPHANSDSNVQTPNNPVKHSLSEVKIDLLKQTSESK